MKSIFVRPDNPQRPQISPTASYLKLWNAISTRGFSVHNSTPFIIGITFYNAYNLYDDVGFVTIRSIK